MCVGEISKRVQHLHAKVCEIRPLAGQDCQWLLKAVAACSNEVKLMGESVGSQSHLQGHALKLSIVFQCV